MREKEGGREGERELLTEELQPLATKALKKWPGLGKVL